MHNPLNFLVGVRGLEPPTSCSQSMRAATCATLRPFHCMCYLSKALSAIRQVPAIAWWIK